MQMDNLQMRRMLQQQRLRLQVVLEHLAVGLGLLRWRKAGQGQQGMCQPS
jgi:hypothetical protein